MRQFLALIQAVCGKLLEGFVRTRLMAELYGADELFRRRIDHPSDDPRVGSVPPLSVFFDTSRDQECFDFLR